MVPPHFATIPPCSTTPYHGSSAVQRGSGLSPDNGGEPSFRSRARRARSLARSGGVFALAPGAAIAAPAALWVPADQPYLSPSLLCNGSYHARPIRRVCHRLH